MAANLCPKIRPHQIRQTDRSASVGDSRAARSAGRAGHHGLGLSIVRAVAAAHDATVDALPRPGGGLELVVTFGVALALTSGTA
jgi:signal transduction histidine kinase